MDEPGHGTRHRQPLDPAEAPGPLGTADHRQAGGVGDSPLHPDELDTYRTDHAAADGSEDAEATPASDARGWFLIGLVLLAVFLAILAWAVLYPLLGT